MQDDCPYNAKGKHYYSVTVGSGFRSDFEPVEYGETAADTMYRRVEYSTMACLCGMAAKKKVRVDVSLS